MFVEWSCGCIGIHPSLRVEDENGNRNPIIVVCCDSNSFDHGIDFIPRNQCRKFYVPLSKQENLDMVKKIQIACAKASRYDDIRMALQIPGIG